MENSLESLRPDWLVAAEAPGTAPQMIHVEGVDYVYTTVRSDVVPDVLPFGVGFPAEHALFVSENAPQEYAPFILAHEVREQKVFSSLPEEMRCVAALEQELQDVQEAMPEAYTTYVQDRKAFFEKLLELYDDPKQAAAKSQAFLTGLHTAAEHLDSLTA